MMENYWMYLLFVLGVVLIVKGGDWFVDGAVWIAEVTKIPQFIIGATIAALEGHSILISEVGNYIAESENKVGMAIGNGIGSVICNTALILAISIIFMPIAINRKDFAPKGLLLLAATCALCLFSLSGHFPLAKAFVLIIIFLFYIIENIRSAKSRPVSEAEEAAPKTDKKSVCLNILRVIVGAVCIVAGSQLLVDNGSQIAAS